LSIARAIDPIVSHSFVKVAPRYTIENCPRPEIIIVPGGGVNITTSDERVVAWINAATREVDYKRRQKRNNSRAKFPLFCVFIYRRNVLITLISVYDIS
jgi:hypothetical protein